MQTSKENKINRQNILMQPGKRWSEIILAYSTLKKNNYHGKFRSNEEKKIIVIGIYDFALLNSICKRN